MKVDIYNIAIFFQWASVLTSAIRSTRLIKKDAIQKYMEYFYWYPTIAVCGATLDIFTNRFDISTGFKYGIFSNYLLLFHFTFLTIFIFRSIGNKRILKWMVRLFFIFISIILFCLFTNDFSPSVPTAFAFTNFGLVIFCCFYYFQVFKSVPSTDLKNEPSFWIINGVFFCMCGTVPFLALHYYIMKEGQYLSIDSMITFLYGVMHLFFIKGYLCSSVLQIDDRSNKRQIQ